MNTHLAALEISIESLAARGLQACEEATVLESAEIADDGRDHRLVPAAAQAWRKLKAAALADGIDLCIISAFRSIDRQAEIVREKLDSGMHIEDILAVCAAPGFSEHHTGLAVDVSTPGSEALEVEFDQTAAYAWLTQRAAEFGFRLSYPIGNAWGYQYEPWHWRFHDIPSKCGPNRRESLESSRFDLVIFDCDGVLVDSEPIANRILCEQLNATGLPIAPNDVMSRFVGRTRDGCLALATELLGRPLPAGFAQEWDAALFDALRREARAIDGVEEVIHALSIPCCAATNGTRDRISLTLDAAGLLPLFEGRIFCADDVARPKPAPDLFLHAAGKMGATPARCAVIEDTPTGARAGKAAGMTVFGYAGGAHSSRAALEAEGAEVFNDMRNLASLMRGKA